jgi:hypothetical protein
VELKEVRGVDDGRAGKFEGALDPENGPAKGDAMEDEAEKVIPVEVKGVDASSPVELFWGGKALRFP